MKININKLDTEAFLEHGIVNKAGVAKSIYPNTNYAPMKLNAKIKKSKGRRLTESDQESIEKTLTDFLTDIGVVEDSESN